MRKLLFTAFALAALVSAAQDKYNYSMFNKLTEIKGSIYVIASVEHHAKMDVENENLLFINTLTGATLKQDFPKDARIGKITHVRIDSLELNRILIPARTVNLDNSKSIDWRDPLKLYVCMIDGSNLKAITPDNFFVSQWEINSSTATMVIIGNTDTNGNGRWDKTDKSEIMLFNLKTLTEIQML